MLSKIVFGFSKSSSSEMDSIKVPKRAKKQMAACIVSNRLTISISIKQTKKFCWFLFARFLPFFFLIWNSNRNNIELILFGILFLPSSVTDFRWFIFIFCYFFLLKEIILFPISWTYDWTLIFSWSCGDARLPRSPYKINNILWPPHGSACNSTDSSAVSIHTRDVYSI
jgi:hypothetical protein